MSRSSNTLSVYGPSSRPPSPTSTHALSRRTSLASTIGGFTLSDQPLPGLGGDHSEKWPLEQWKASDDEGSIPRHPYSSYLSFLLPQWPHLSTLQAWLSQPMPRQHKQPVTVLDLRESAVPIRRDFPDDTGAKDTGGCYAALATSLKRPTPTNVKGRVIVVPYLQPSLVQALGAQFDVDPDFWLGCLGAAEGDMPSDEWLRIPYLREGRQGVEEERVSVLVHLPLSEEGHWTAVVVFNTADAPGPIVGLSPSNIRNFAPRPRFSAGPVVPANLHYTYLDHLQDQPSNTYKQHANDPFYSLHFLFSYAIRSWATRIHALSAGISAARRASELAALRQTLGSYERTLAVAQETVETGGKPAWKRLRMHLKASTKLRPALSAAALERDYAHVAQTLRDALRRVDAAAAAHSAPSAASSPIPAGAEKLVERIAADIQRLTWVALVMLPLGVACQFFGVRVEAFNVVFTAAGFAAVAAGLLGAVVLAVGVGVLVAACLRRRERRVAAEKADVEGYRSVIAEGALASTPPRSRGRDISVWGLYNKEAAV